MVQKERARGDRTAEKARRAAGGEELQLGTLLGPRSLLDLEVATKEELLWALADAVARDRGLADPEEIYRGAMERESVVNTYVGDGVAVPHARLEHFEGFAIAIARSPKGFPYGVETPEPVVMAILLVGSDTQQNEHVRLLSTLAAAVKDEGLRQEIMKAEDAQAVARALDAGAKVSTVNRRPHHLSQLLLSHARKIAQEVGATSVLVAIDTQEELAILKRLPRRQSFVVATASPGIADSAERIVDRVIRLPRTPLRRDTLVRLGTLMGISSGLISRNDVVAFLTKQAKGALDTITILDVGREFGRFLTTSGEISSKVHPGVLERVLILASELGSEGREGKPVGTIFVVGDPEELAPYCQQLVINPFRGYPAEERNILDPTLRETIKEFSGIDGAFIIQGDGVIHSAGTYLQPGEMEVKLPGGYGTRHRAACAITLAADCMSVAVSASTGQVMLFTKGEPILNLEKGAGR
jgi:diadenylate cyclase